MKRSVLAVFLALAILGSAACGASEQAQNSSVSDVSVSDTKQSTKSQMTTSTGEPTESSTSTTSTTSTKPSSTTSSTTKVTTTTTKTTEPPSVDITWEKPKTSNTSNQYASYIDYRTPLTNSYNKLTKENKLTVAYIGGSVTNGSGALNMETDSWRGLTGQWLNRTFPKADITNINAAIGATGSMLGLFRLDKDVVKYKPDLLFVEFAINDEYYGNIVQARASFETLIREARQKMPYCDIVVLITSDQARVKQYYGKSGAPHQIGRAHMEIAEAYGISVINIADAFVKEVGEITGNNQWYNDNTLWRSYVTDGVHPNTAGYALWFNYVKEYLENSLLHTDYSGYNRTARKVPAVQNYYLIDGERKAFFGEEIEKLIVSSDGDFVQDTSSRGNDYLALDKGESVTLKFTGTQCAIWVSYDNVDFNIQCTVDGKEANVVSGTYADPYFLVSGLKAGEHTITITHAPNSRRTTFGICGFFMRDENKQTTSY